MKTCVRVAMCLVALAWVAPPAAAAPITVATLDWTAFDCNDPISGACLDQFAFTVDGAAGGSFSDVWVNLTFGDGTPNAGFALTPSPVGPGGFLQDFSPFFGSLIATASLDLSRLAFSSLGTLSLGPLALTERGGFQTVAFEARGDSPNPVSEPGSLVLVAAALAAAMWVKSRRRAVRRPETAPLRARVSARLWRFATPA